MKIYLKIDKKLKKFWVPIDSFLPWTQNSNCSPRHCVSPQISTFGPAHIDLIGTFGSASKQISCQKKCHLASSTLKKFQSFCINAGCKLRWFLAFFIRKYSIFGRKIAQNDHSVPKMCPKCAPWYSYQKWRSMGADTVYNHKLDTIA